MSIPHDDYTVPQTDNRIAQTDEPRPRKPLRLWPGIALAVLLILFRFVLPVAAPDAMILGMPAMFIGVLGGIICGLLILVWWLCFSRARWYERLGALALMALALFATSRIIHVSIRTGSMGFLFPVLSIPMLSLAFVAVLSATRRLSVKARRAVVIATILVASGGWALVRTGGFDSNFDHDFAWRWSKSHEERLLAQQADEPLAPVAVAVKPGAEWPGFRGSDRDGVTHGARINTDWSKAPPVELWRRPVGPGWSSFAVSGDLVYTQEQRGNEEVVACYNLKTGKPVWRHSDAARFWESNAGAGPRATPTLHNGRVYTFGGTGILNALDAATGAVVWTRNAASDTKRQVPAWGFSSSPLVVGDLIIVAAAGTLAAYDLATGAPRWFGPDDGSGYSSPHLFTIQGVPQVVLLNGAGAISVAPADGKLLWKHPLSSSSRIVQPAATADGDVLVHEGEGNEMRRIAVANGPDGWKAEERWSTFGINPYFNDFVVHKGHAYGFNGSSIACIDLKDGQRKWKGGTYGAGQLVLLPEQDLLLVLSEDGDIALVGASADQFKELGRVKAIQGKTWNHPVLVGDVVLVRNGQEMAAFRLAAAGG